MECDQWAPGTLGGGKEAGVHPGVTPCAIFSSSLVTKLLWFLSPELSAELRQRHELALLASRLSGSLFTTTLSFSPTYSDPQAHVLFPQAEGCASVQCSNLGNGFIYHISTSVVWKQVVQQQPLKPSISVLADNVRHRMGWLFLIGLLKSHRIQTQAPEGSQEKNPSCTLVTGRCLSALHTQWIKRAWNRTSLKCIYIKSMFQPIQHHMS